MMVCRSVGRVRNDRGFVLVAALGALAVLMTVAFMAAGSAQHTFMMTVERQRDRRITDHIMAASEILPKLASQPGSSGSAVRTVRLSPAPVNDPAGVEVSLTLGMPVSSAVIAPALTALEGDEIAVIEARRRDGAGAARRSTFLVNSRGMRSAPILIREERL
jgi:hypothetical protein